MKYLSLLVVVLAWLITTESIVSLKTVGDTVTPVYKFFCVSAKPPISQGRYQILTPYGYAFVPIDKSILEPVVGCP